MLKLFNELKIEKFIFKYKSFFEYILTYKTKLNIKKIIKKMKLDSDFEFPLKVIVIGDTCVGKTNFIFRFVENRFSLNYVSTVGFDYRSKIITLPKSKKKVKLQIWDTAGQERYNAVNKNLFQKVQGVIIMYDITNRASFENINKWLYLLSQNVSDKAKILVGSKLDLSEEKRIVTEEEGQNLADKNNMPFYETSSKTGENVEKIFFTLAQNIYENLSNENINDNASVKIIQNPERKKKGCCK